MCLKFRTPAVQCSVSGSTVCTCRCVRALGKPDACCACTGYAIPCIAATPATSCASSCSARVHALRGTRSPRTSRSIAQDLPEQPCLLADEGACLRSVLALTISRVPLSLGVNEPRCGVSMPNADAGSRVSPGLAICMPRGPECLVLAGSAPRRSGHTEVYGSPRAAQGRSRGVVGQLVDKLVELPPPATDHSMLLSTSLQTALSHLPRCTLWNSIKGAVHQLECAVRDWVLHNIKQPDGELSPWPLCTVLAPRHAGQARAKRGAIHNHSNAI
jgi:hypothetical protein